MRSLLFYIGFIFILAVMSTVCCLLCFLPFRLLQRIATSGNHLVMVWLRLCCNIHIKVTGQENLPQGPCVILSNHQSTWETFYLQWYFQPASVILKRELLWIPLFGWGLYFMRPIAIKRSNPAGAIRYVLKCGKKRLQEGIRVVIYPEGTRVPANSLGEFKTSGAAIAGSFWFRDRYSKRSGTIHMHIGPAIDTSEGNARELTAKARHWISDTLQL
jgi:1-acyl-sn-glycerol-3-phosphate acyltransferase